MYSPARLAASITNSPLRAVNGVPLIVTLTAFGSGGGASASAGVFSTVVIDSDSGRY
jgi:hypothetical protein